MTYYDGTAGSQTHKLSRNLLVIFVLRDCSCSLGSGVPEPQVAENRYLPLTGGIALTTVYALTCYTVIWLRLCCTQRMLNAVSHFDDIPRRKQKITGTGTADNQWRNFKFCLPPCRIQNVSPLR